MNNIINHKIGKNYYLKNSKFRLEKLIHFLSFDSNNNKAVTTKSFVRYSFLALLTFMGLTLLSVESHAQNKKLNIMAEAATGSNRLLGDPRWNLGSLWNTAGDSSIGGFNPSGEDPLTLSTETPFDTIMASAVDQFVLDAFGITIDDVGIPLNTTIHQNFTTVETDASKGQLPSSTQVPIYALSSGAPQSITLEEWLNASGMARISCKDEMTKIIINFDGLVVNGLYSVWGTFGALDGTLFSVPLAGTPNIFVADSNGTGNFKRKLNGCPLEINSDGPTLLFIEVAYHSDGMIHGGMPDLPHAGLPFGATTHTTRNPCKCRECLLIQ